MKSILSFSFLFLLPSLLWAQMFGEQQVINQFDGWKLQVAAADMDLDGDQDPVYMINDSLFIMENGGGATWSTEHVIDSLPFNFLYLINFESFTLTDIDQDQHMDILVKTHASSKWGSHDWHLSVMYNQGSYLLEKESLNAYSSSSISGYATSMFDADSNMDIIVQKSPGTLLLYSDSTLFIPNGWFGEGLGVFEETLRGLAVEKIDSDTLEDLVVGSVSEGNIHWYKHLSNDSLDGPFLISNQVLDPEKVLTAHLNSDNLPDVISASSGDDKIAWYPNLGGGNFGPQQIISTSADSAMDVFAIDLDNDLDIDLLSASAADNKIAWYANDGNGNFGPQQIICDTAMGARSVYAADLDNDGDIDVLSASALDGKIAWYENLLIITGVKEESAISANIYPNPFSDQTTITVNGLVNQGSIIVITDVLGRPVATRQLTSNSITVNSRETGQGFFLVHLNGVNGQRRFLGKLIVQ